MYNMIKKLITKCFYATQNDAQDKLDVFFAVGRLTNEQYTELSALADSVYCADGEE